jgi:hypothetical protein
MIVKTAKGWQVRSEKGRPLSKDDLSREEAKERLREVEEQKSMKKWIDKNKGK